MFFFIKGCFSSVYEKDINNDRSIYSMKDFIIDFDMLIIVCLVYGKVLVVLCIFMGVIVFREMVFEDFIVVSIIMNKRNVLIEFFVFLLVIVYFLNLEELFSDLMIF